MPDRPEFIPPPWNESAAFRETTLRLFPDPKDRAALLHLVSAAEQTRCYPVKNAVLSHRRW